MNSGTFLMQSDEFNPSFNANSPSYHRQNHSPSPGDEVTVKNELENLQNELVDLTNQLETIEQIRNKPRKGISIHRIKSIDRNIVYPLSKSDTNRGTNRIKL